MGHRKLIYLSMHNLQKFLLVRCNYRHFKFIEADVGGVPCIKNRKILILKKNIFALKFKKARNDLHKEEDLYNYTFF